jgi:hypothetical protein
MRELSNSELNSISGAEPCTGWELFLLWACEQTCILQTDVESCKQHCHIDVGCE